MQRPNDGSMTFSQARARLANTAMSLWRQELLDRLEALGALPADARKLTNRGLAYKLAWALLPGGNEKVRQSNAAAD